MAVASRTSLQPLNRAGIPIDYDSCCNRIEPPAYSQNTMCKLITPFAVFVGGLTALTTLGCLGRSTPLPVQPANGQVINQVFGGKETHEIANSATTIRACRLKMKPDSASPATGEYEYEAGPFLPLTAEQSTHFLKRLQSPNSYEFDVAKACIPIYGVRLQCEAPEGAVDVDLCFSCNILAVRRDGKIVGGEDFDPIRPNLVQLCKQLFPDDAEIQNLTNR
jgi:hypothetical protein